MRELLAEILTYYMKEKILICLVITFISTGSMAQTATEVPPPPSSDSMSKVFSKVEFEAEFPGGAASWIEFLEKHLKANVPIKKKAPAGTYRVIVRFIVSRDGTISEISAETNFGYGMEEEVIRVIKKGPKWTPASQNGKTVNAYRRQPVTFVVSDK